MRLSAFSLFPLFRHFVVEIPILLHSLKPGYCASYDPKISKVLTLLYRKIDHIFFGHHERVITGCS